MNTKEERYEIYKSIEERLKTFHSWPIRFLKAEDFANDGFIFSGRQDLVSCIFCGLEIDDWEEGDSVAKEHREQASHCPYIVAIDGMDDNEGNFE